MSKRVDAKRIDLIRHQATWVSSVLSNPKHKPGEVLSAIIGLAFLIEQVLKMKLSAKNHLIIFKGLPKPELLQNVLQEKFVENLDTITLKECLTLNHFLFPRSPSAKKTKEMNLLADYRNKIYHHIVEFVAEPSHDLGDLANTAFTAIRPDIEKITGHLSLPLTKDQLTQEGYQRLLNETVKRKLSAPWAGENPLIYAHIDTGFSSRVFSSDLGQPYPDNQCPRCTMFTFKQVRGNNFDPFSFTFKYSDDGLGNEAIYRCTKCGLELTPEEYRTAQTKTPTAWRH